MSRCSTRCSTGAFTPLKVSRICWWWTAVITNSNSLSSSRHSRAGTHCRRQLRGRCTAMNWWWLWPRINRPHRRQRREVLLGLITTILEMGVTVAMVIIYLLPPLAFRLAALRNVATFTVRSTRRRTRRRPSASTASSRSLMNAFDCSFLTSASLDRTRGK